MTMTKRKKLPEKYKGTIIETMDRTLGDSFQGPSWDRWRAILKGAHALPMSPAERQLFEGVAERKPPKKRVRELWIVGGRRGGKDSIASLIIADAAMRFQGKRRQIAGITLPAMRKGERATVFCIGPDRDTARVVLGYVKGYFDDAPELAAMITRETRDGFELVNGVDVVVAASDYRGVRGRAVLSAVLDETAMMRDEFSSKPDTELYAALKPGTLTLRDQSMIVGISTPLTRTGLLWEKFSKHYGKDDDEVLVVKATSLQLNPLLDAQTINAEIEADPVKNRSEYLVEWRDSITNFLSPEIIDAAILRGKTVLSPRKDLTYHAFVDVSGGVNDSHTLAIGYKDEDGTCITACAREIKSADTESVVAEFSAAMKSYNVSVVTGDRYGQAWVQDAFQRHGITLRHSHYDRSSLYLNLVPALTSGQARILDRPRLRSQFLSLERRVTRGTGKEIVDHPSSGADDLANAVAGCLVLAATAERHKVTWTFWSVGGDVALEQDEEDEQRRRLYVRTENLDSAGRPIMPTTDVPIVRPQGPRRIGGNDHWVH
jgi:hypothetical protein